ncbi:unnamed protein product, partial [Protopolystoma xenopodis]
SKDVFEAAGALNFKGCDDLEEEENGEEDEQEDEQEEEERALRKQYRKSHSRRQSRVRGLPRPGKPSPESDRFCEPQNGSPNSHAADSYETSGSPPAQLVENWDEHYRLEEVEEVAEHKQSHTAGEASQQVDRWCKSREHCDLVRPRGHAPLAMSIAAIVGDIASL